MIGMWRTIERGILSAGGIWTIIGCLAAGTAAGQAFVAKNDEVGSRRFFVNTWEMEAVSVEGRQTSGLREEEYIGESGNRFQPRWTARRRFPTTHIFVRPEGESSLGFWTIINEKRDSGTEVLTKTELELGLPGRLQLDVYGISRHAEGTGRTYFDQAVEMRYALANWDELPGNPALYYEWLFKEDAPDSWEAKLLFGDELATRWHWGTNFVWEQEVHGEEETSLAMTNGISYTLFDEALSIGMEDRLAVGTTKDTRSTWMEDLRVGPSIQWQVTNRLHVDLVPLFGITHNSRKMETYVVVGWEF